MSLRLLAFPCVIVRNLRKRILSPLRLPVPPSRLEKAFLLYVSRRLAAAFKDCFYARIECCTSLALSGSSTRNAEPLPGLLSTLIVPPCF
jgi:hypothetical protein